MLKANYHTHTTFCDGSNTPQEMVEAALYQVLKYLGFLRFASSHWMRFNLTRLRRMRLKFAVYTGHAQNERVRLITL